MMLVQTRHVIGFLLSIALILIASILTSPAFADAAPPEQPPGSNLAPGEEVTQVQMFAETVLIEVQTAPWPGVRLSSVVRDWAKVTATFTMLNQGQVEESMQVRFPLTNPSGWGDGWGDYPEIEDIRIWVDGLQVPTTRLTAPSPVGKDQPPVEWAGFDVTFPVGEEVEIETRYSQRATGYHPVSEFLYFLETGAGWKGPIGSGELIVRFPYAAGPESLLVNYSNEGVRFVGADARWSFIDLEPTWEDNLRVHIIEPGYWLAVIDAQRVLDENPADGEAWGVLARALKRVSLEYKGWVREDEAGQDLYERSVAAYKKAVSLTPDVAKWHAGFAELLWHKLTFWYLPDYGAPEMVEVLEQIQLALAIEPQNEQAWNILEEVSFSAPLAVSIDETDVDYLLLTATVQPSPTPTLENTATPVPTTTMEPSSTHTPAILPDTLAVEEETATNAESEATGNPPSCLGGLALMGFLPLFATAFIRMNVDRSGLRHRRN